MDLKLNNKTLRVEVACKATLMFSGVRIITPEGKETYFRKADNPLYLGYQSLIEWNLVSPFVVYQGAKIVLSPTDHLVFMDDILIAVLPQAAVSSIARLEEKPEEGQGALDA